MTVNGKKVEGRTISFDEKGLSVGDGEKEEVVVPADNSVFAESFDFVGNEDLPVTEEDFEDDVDFSSFEEYELEKKTKNKAILTFISGVVVGCAVSALVSNFFRKD
jgi:hypothetical protein